MNVLYYVCAVPRVSRFSQILWSSCSVSRLFFWFFNFRYTTQYDPTAVVDTSTTVVDSNCEKIVLRTQEGEKNRNEQKKRMTPKQPKKNTATPEQRQRERESRDSTSSIPLPAPSSKQQDTSKSYLTTRHTTNKRRTRTDTDGRYTDRGTILCSQSCT